MAFSDAYFQLLSYTLGPILFLGGAAFAMAPKKTFQRTKTPMMGGPSQTSPLHTDQAFSYTRNPMYLGITIGLAGAAIMTNCLVHLLVFPALNLLIMDTYYIPKEEMELKKKFGKEYAEYQSRVRRWI